MALHKPETPMTAGPLAAPLAPVSWGELIDKITILEIKSQRLREDAALANVRGELALLLAIEGPVLVAQPAVLEIRSRLRAVNEKLWEVEDRLREKEAEGDFGPEFIELSRSVYRNNDERAALKRAINIVLPCGIAEEKRYGCTTPGDSRSR
jgi:Family of unknown function (DUF6165)